MYDTTTDGQHAHRYGGDTPTRAERRTLIVVGVTLAMMIAELVAGWIFGSMALLADGWHMGTHAAALGVAAFAYRYARRHAQDPRYTFGTGKVGALAGFASAVGLAVIALMVAFESVARLTAHAEIHFDEALLVAVVGLVVNLVCAWLLRDDDHHDHGHAHGHAHPHHDDEHHHDEHHHDDHDHRDHNLRAAYLHVMADAATSVAAIVALLAGKLAGWVWMDPLMGVVGALVIARWSLGLLRETSAVLLDAEGARRLPAIRQAIEGDGDSRVVDLHLWRVGPRHMAAIVAVVSAAPRTPDEYKRRLAGERDLVHVTIEIHRA